LCIRFFCPFRTSTECYALSLHDALPIFNDMIETTNPGKLTRIYMMVVGEVCDRQIHGVTGIVPKDLENKLFIRRESAEPSAGTTDRKSTRLNSSHVKISYAVFCLKKKRI